MTIQLRFAAGSASASELQQASDEALRRGADSEVDIPTDAQVTIVQEKDGLDPTLTLIVITIVTNLGTEAAVGVWKEYIWPHLRRSIGADALGEPISDEHTDEDGPEGGASDADGPAS